MQRISLILITPRQLTRRGQIWYLSLRRSLALSRTLQLLPMNSIRPPVSWAVNPLSRWDILRINLQQGWRTGLKFRRSTWIRLAPSTSVLDQFLIRLTMSTSWHSRAVRLSEVGPAMLVLTKLNPLRHCKWRIFPIILTLVERVMDTLRNWIVTVVSHFHLS